LKLIITEKPSVGQSIGKVLGARKRYDGYLEGGGYVVSWCVGHLVELAEPDAYDAKYAKWNKDDLPILPGEWQYRVSAATKKQFGILKTLMNRDDVESLVNCCDAGREGELIFRLVYHQCRCKKPFERLWISSMEDEAIKDGFAKLRPGTEYDALYEAALCRERADWTVGINATRLFSCLYGPTLNVGRVMTPTLAMVVMRETAIRGFTPEPFFTVQIVPGSFQAGGERMKEKSEAAAIADACQKAGTAEVTKVEQKEKSEKAPALYDLTSLQRDANRQLGFTAQQTLDYTQSLYEKKLVTYPRTDSRYLTDDMAEMLPELVTMAAQKCGIAADAPTAVNAAQVINSKKVTDHHAIIPTRTLAGANLAELPSGEKAVLMLIATRLVCAVGEPYRYTETAVELTCAGHVFKTKGKTVTDMGWKAYAGKQPENAEADAVLPVLEENAALSLVSVEVKEGKTSPPKHFTEDLLLSSMEAAGADEIPEEAERRGIGTPATRAGIIEKLVQKGFVERKGDKKTKILVPTSKGEALVTVVPEQIQSPTMTAEWEEKLLQMERGQYEASHFMEEINSMIRDMVENYECVSGADVLLPPKGAVVGNCPACGAEVLDKPKGYFCSNKECRFALWKSNRYFDSIGKKLTASIAEKLLVNGKVRLKGCKSARTGKTYDATLVMNTDEKGKAQFSLEFEKGGKR
jgi:DNA topoisomerase-3